MDTYANQAHPVLIPLVNISTKMSSSLTGTHLMKVPIENMQERSLETVSMRTVCVGRRVGEGD